MSISKLEWRPDGIELEFVGPECDLPLLLGPGETVWTSVQERD